MKFFVDTADLAEIRELASTGLLDGVTTNPSLVAKAKRDFKEIIAEICALVPGPVSADIRRDVVTYVKDVHEDEWAKMAVGESSDVVAKHLGQLTKTVFAFNPGTTQEMVLYQTALRLLAQLTDNRNERLDSADGSVPTVLWFVLIAGGLITLGYPAFFGSTNLAAQVLMTASLAILVAIALLLSIVFDRPFTGDVTVSATPFERALAEMPAASSSP